MLAEKLLRKSQAVVARFIELELPDKSGNYKNLK